MLVARQSSSLIVIVGPVLDAAGAAVTDGVVADFKISKNGGAPAALDGSATLTHRVTGHYSLALTANDLNTVGHAAIIIDDTTNACPVVRINVFNTTIYDALYAAGAVGYSTQASVDTVASYVDTEVAAILAAVDTEVAAIKAKTDNLPAAPAAVGSAMTLADGAITDAKITFPAETAGRPTTFLAAMRRVWEWTVNKRIRSRATGAVQLRNAADSADLETQTQTTTGAAGSEVDTQTKGV